MIETKIMKKSKLLFAVLFTGISLQLSAQARQEFNFGLIGANFEIPVHKDVTIAPGASTNFDLDWLNIGVRGSYYFDNLFGITDDAWDVYGGADAGYSIYNGNDDHKHKSEFDIGLHVGGRWFWNEKWGLYVELGGARVQGPVGGVGVTMKL